MSRRLPTRRTSGLDGASAEVLGALNIDESDIDLDNSGMETLTFDDLMQVQHENCFACQRINASTLRDNEYYYKMLQLYRDNATGTCLESVYCMVRDYFINEIKPFLDADNEDDGLKEWPLEVIREHFKRHTLYATDEIMRQINVTTALRDHLMNNLVQVNSKSAKYDVKYIQTLINLNQEIRKLRSMKSEIPGWFGFDSTLNY